MRVVLHGYGAMNKLVHELLGDEVVCVLAPNTEGKIDFHKLNGINYDVIIDFSHFSLIDELIEYISKVNTPCMFATTKLNDEQIFKIDELSSSCPVFQDYNTSFGVYVTSEITKQLSRMLKDYDVEIIEKHHTKKVDSPSGTAKRLESCILQEREGQSITDYSNTDGKQCGDIGIHAIRSGSIVGEHEVIFGSSLDSISIKHTANSKELFVKGAIDIAKILVTKENGKYDLERIYKERI